MNILITQTGRYSDNNEDSLADLESYFLKPLLKY